MKMRRLFFLVALFLLLSGISHGQYYFGKNKIQYTDFDWQVLTTQHFEIYFYTEEREIAQIAASCAEESYRFLENKFNHRIKRKIPLVIYSSPNYFAQTNIIPSLLPESVAGFTEYMKGRMVVPFDGSYSNFARVLQHELVHVFVMHKIPYVMKSHRRLNYTGLPLWFEEGLAEHWSRSWDSEADMMLRDLVVSGRFLRLEDIYQVFGTYLMYKIGEAFCAHLEQEYGDDKITLLLENYWKGKSFAQVFELTFNKTLKDEWTEWEYSLKKKYFPELEDKDLPVRVSTRLTSGGINIKPEPLLFSDEEWVVFKSNQLGYSSIRMMSSEGEKKKSVTLVKGERSPQFESLHLMKSKIGVSKDGKIAFVSKSHENDVLYVYDIEQRKITRKERFGDLIELSSPDWSPDVRKVAFVGTAKDGYSDLYMYEFEENLLTRLTDDIYEERDPGWSPDGQRIAFASDRNPWGVDGFLNLFLLTLPGNEVIALTSGPYHDLAPDWSADGKQLVFSSDRNGPYDLYLLTVAPENDSSQMRQLTSLLTGAFDPTFSPDGGTVFFTAYEEYSFQINKLNLDSAVVGYADPVNQPKLALNTYQPGWRPKKIEGDQQSGSVKYRNRFSFDVAQSVISYDAVYGTVGGFQAAFTDMLGNHQYFILLGNSARSTDDFLSSFNLGLTYLNRTHRVNYGYGLYHLKDEYYDEFYGFYNERQYGLLGMVSYPLSKFKRIEASFFLRQSDRDVYIQNRERKALLSTGYVSWVLDTSIWDYVGPIDGTRFNLTVGLSLNLNDGEAYNKLVLCDLRKYLRIRKNSCFAVRLMGFSSSGKEPQRLYLGGSWSLRGYDRKAFYGRHLLLASNELRFPLIDNLYIGFPFGRISFQAIRGALFFDAGNAWEDKFDQLYGSFGIGARISLGYVMVLRFDVSRTTDFKTISKKTDFDFFFGWNF
jgi:Tol biopolymer transport system component